MQNNMDRLILAALDEDIPTEDLSTNAIITGYVKGKAQLLCKQDGIIAGLSVFARAFTLQDDTIEVIFHCQEGDAVQSGELLAEVIGDIRIILTGERTALNYLQRMSGIATHTRKIVDLLEGSGITLLDTRKTTPNNRIFEKYAVKVGGGHNHRFSLSDGIMLKDNHIAAAGGIKKAVAAAREYASFVHKIEVEVENLEMVNEALEAKTDIIMLDNMTPAEMKEAVRLIDGRALVECSGNLTAENIAALRDTGVDYLSSGALTHSSAILDLSLKNLERI
ncbi:MAG: carboxylating nicotinate-nucleotide diphosphorylase [Trichococcus sp.]